MPNASLATTGRVLVADDQVNILEALKLLLGSEGYDVTTAPRQPNSSRRSSAPTSTSR